MAKVKWVRSTGGPLLLLPVALRRHWSGINPSKDPLNDARFRWDETMNKPSDYDRACDAASSEVAVLEVASGHALILGGEGLTTTWVPSGGKPGGTLIRWVYGDTKVSVGSMIEKLPDEMFQSTGLVFPFTGRIAILFDSAIPGSEVYDWISPDSHHRFALTSGRYEVSSTEFNPAEDFKLLLHRLTPECNP